MTMKTALTFLLTLPLFLATLASAEAEPLTVSGITFKPGDGWTSKPPKNSMRAGEYQITPDGAAGPLTAVFYYFGAGQGGSVEANVSRWIGQFEGKPETETKEHKFDGDKTVTIVSAKGTYLESMGGPFSGPKTPRPGYRLLGAIVPGNDAYIYVKLTGPANDVDAIAEKFTAFATSPFKK